MSRMDRIEQAFARKDPPTVRVGDTVDVHVRIMEGDKERVQVFSGTVIRKRGGGLGASYTVRRIVQGQGVERTFPVNSPFVKAVKVKRSGKVRRARLYYLRDRRGKSARLREIIRSRAPAKKTKKAAPKPKADPVPETEPSVAPEPAAADE